MLTQKEVITSKQNPTVKKISSLSDKKGRRVEGLFRFDGIKLFGEAVACGLDVKYVVLCDRADENILSSVESAVACGTLASDKIMLVSEGVFEKLSEQKAPEGIITVASFIGQKHREISASATDSYSVSVGERILIAESLRDPGNLGTVIRSCAALGIDRLIISSDCADLYNPKTIRGAMGGLFRLNIDIVELDAMPRLISALRASGRRIFAAALHTEALTIGELKLRASDCFVIGNEGHGLSAATVGACDACAIIPMVEGSESLNAAAAAAICIWETVRAK